MGAASSLTLDAYPQRYGALAQYPNSPVLRERFSVTSRFGDPIQLYTESADGGSIFVPRAVCPIPPGDADIRVDGYSIGIQSKFVPRNDEQARVVPEALAHLNAGRSFVLEAPTGFGKTVVMGKLIAEVDRTALIVCTKDDLVKQARQRMLEHTTLTPDDIGIIQQDRCHVFGKKVVIASLQSLAIPDRYPVGIRQYFGFVLFDEVHRLGADTFGRVAGMFPSRLRLGVSATPKRIDGKEVVFEAHIGPVLVRAKGVPMKPKVLRYNTGWQLPRWKIDGKMQKMPHSPGKCGHVFKHMAKDPHRNRLLVYQALKCHQNKRRLVIFSKLTDHLQLLETLLIKQGVSPNAFGHYYGAMSGKKLDAAAAKPVILATPEKMGEGTDIPWLDACVLAMPMANVEQIVGRVLREHEGKPQPVVFDNVDADSNVFIGYANKRNAYYQRIGADVKNMEAEAA